MRVAYVLNTSDKYCGASKSLMQLLKGLKPYGVCPIIVAPNDDGITQEARDCGFEVLTAPIRPNHYPRHDTRFNTFRLPLRLLYWQVLNILAVRRLKKEFRKHPVDIIHTNSSVIDVGMNVAKALNIPHVFHFREYADKDFGFVYFPTRKKYINKVLASKSRLVCITHDILQYHGFTDNKKAQVIYNGIASTGNIAKNDDKRKYFLYAGRLETAKGVDTLIEAYADYVAKAGNNVVPLLIAGDDNPSPYLHKLKEQIAALQLSDNEVKFLGKRNDVSELMQHALAIVIPSLHEGFGRCMAEAMFNDCLVIGRNTGGTKEQFDNGIAEYGTNIGLPYTTNRQLTEHLLYVAETPPSEFSQVREQAQQLAARLYSTEACANSVMKLYNEIIHSHI